MKAILLLLAVGPAAALWWGSKARSVWRPGPIEIDGLSDDWRGVDTDDAHEISFAFCNDEKFLYVLFGGHTREAKDQLSGAHGQELAVWIDPEGNTKHVRGFKVGVAAPGAATRAVENVGLPEGASLQIGPFDKRGVVEARIPLSAFGSPPPRTASVGLEASVSRDAPVKKRQHIIETDNGTDPNAKNPYLGDRSYKADPDNQPVSVWVRVTFAEKP